MKISILKIQKLLRLSRVGTPDRRVARKLKLAKTTVRKYRKQSGIQPIGHALRHSESVLKFINGKAKCRRCGFFKSKKQFRPLTRNVCADCQNERQTHHLHTDLRRYFNRKLCIARILARKKNLPFRMTTEELLVMYESQERKCFYTDYPMVSNAGRDSAGKRRSVSIDKIVPKLGYTPKNIVLCTTQANLIKNDQTLAEMKMWMPTWHRRLVDAGKARR